MFKITCYDKDNGTYIDFTESSDLEKLIKEAEQMRELLLKDKLKNTNGEPFDWIEIVDCEKESNVVWASYGYW